MQSSGSTVVVAGGGYAGVLAANRIQGRLRGRARVVLVAPDEHLTDRIRLHEAAVHGAVASRVRQPYDRLLARGVERIAGRVTGLEPDARSITIDQHGSALRLAYDALVLALGSGLHAELASQAPYANALQDAAHADQLATELPKLAPGERVVIVGGGLSAIELATEVAETYPALSVELVAQKLGEGLDAPTQAILTRELSKLGVGVREGARAQQLTPDGVRLSDGTLIAARLSVWATGFMAAPTPLSSTWKLARDAAGRVLVDEHLRVPGAPEIFVAGDFAAPPAASIGTGLRSNRMGCVSAMPLGAHAADQVVRLLNRQPLRPFRFQFVLQCISLGRTRGLVVFVDRDDQPTGRVITGRVAALIKESICRMVIGSLRFERLWAGLYTWPDQSALAPKQLTP